MAGNSETKPRRLNIPMLWGVGVTLIILVAAAYLGASETCPPGLAGSESCPTKWSLFFESPPNEVGDALAGFAGALAFVWIIVTVAMQSIELREQREVLTLQKDEMEMQREATQDMAKAMAAQADIFLDEQRQREERRLGDLLNRQISGFAHSLVRRPIEIEYQYVNESDVVGFRSFILGFICNEDLDAERNINLLIEELSEFLEQKTDHNKQAILYTNFQFDLARWGEFRADIWEILENEPRLSKADAQRIKNMQLKKYDAMLDQIMPEEKI